MSNADNLLTFLQRHHTDASLIEVLCAIANCCVDIAAMVRRAGVQRLLGALDSTNVQGEVQKTLDVRADQAFMAMSRACPRITRWVSEENPDVQTKAQISPVEAGYTLLYDPLDGSSNIDVNMTIGSIFSLYPDHGTVLCAGSEQCAAGYALYGPSLMLVLSTGQGTHGFSWDAEVQQFVLTHPKMAVPVETQEYAIHAARIRHWPLAVQRYIQECDAGADGIRGKDFRSRWAGSMVADVHRVLCRGGVFLYPLDAENASKGGKLRLMYEANPMAMLVTQAGGMAHDGMQDILQLRPEHHHQRVGVILGSSQETERLREYYQDAQKLV